MAFFVGRWEIGYEQHMHVIPSLHFRLWVSAVGMFLLLGCQCIYAYMLFFTPIKKSKPVFRPSFSSCCGRLCVAKMFYLQGLVFRGMGCAQVDLSSYLMVQ